ncbi:MAG TPA: FGGY-family carbohydrate kinase [Anaerolineales bacterium]
MNDSRASEYVLVIDLGTGGPKVGLVDAQGRVAACTSASVQILFIDGGGAEHDPAEWWSSIQTCVNTVMRESGVAPKSVIAVAVTTMWSVALPVDEHGTPLMNAMSWMDVRGSRYNWEIVKGFPSAQGYQLGKLLKYVDRHGFPPSPSDSLGHMLFIKHERPDIYKRTYKFFEPMDYLNMRLTGKFAGTQNTMLPMLVVDNRKLDRTEYDPWLLKMSTIDPAKLPELLPIDGVLGTLTPAAAAELGLSPDTLVTCGVNDNSSSAVGAGSIGSAEPAAVMGNSGHMAFHLPFKKSDLAHSISTIPSGIKDSYLFWADLGNNGTVLDTCLKTLLNDKDHLEPGAVPAAIFERADRIAEPTPPGSGGVLFLPWFNGSISPGQDQYLRGGFLNMSHSIGRGHLVRAVFEGLSMNWRWLRGPAEKLAGRKFEYWRLTGGGALSNVWAQIMADVVGIPMHRQANPRHGNVIGMGLLAFSRLGKLNLQDIPAMIQFDRIFEPQEQNRSRYDGMYAQWSAAREKIRPVMHALNKV